jgi:acyl-coenzyme A synthetase/AMP-(fatty) acid ligase
MSEVRFPRPEDHFPPERIAGFRSSGAWPDHLIWDYVERWAAERPDSLAFHDGDRGLTFLALRDLSAALAQSLADLGIARGDRVVMQVPNWVEGVIAYCGITRLGAIMVPQSAIYRRADVGYVVQKTQAAALIVPGVHRGFDHLEMAKQIKASSPSLRHLISVRDPRDEVIDFESLLGAAPYTGPVPTADDVHVILFTSGTTARPKACVHTSNTYLFCALVQGYDAYEVTPDDVMFMPSPIAHTTGLSCGVDLPIMNGIPSILLDAWDPEVALERISRFGCSMSVSAMPFLATLAQAYDPARHDISRFRLFGTGGAPIPGPVVREAQSRLGCDVITLFGGTESQPGTYTRIGDPIERVTGSDGRAADGVDIAVLDELGVEVPHGVEGELCGRSPGRLLCYWEDEAQTAEAIDGNGWFHTGDLGRMDDDGYIRVTGRKKDIIVRGGLNLSALEIEELALSHPRVADVAVVGDPDERLGERACAFVVTDDGQPLDLAELTSFMTEQGATKQKLPERIELVAELPRTTTGKIEKYKLRAMLAAAAKVM